VKFAPPESEELWVLVLFIFVVLVLMLLLPLSPEFSLLLDSPD
jgi:hypothetical protein